MKDRIILYTLLFLNSWLILLGCLIGKYNRIKHD